MNFFLYSISQY